MKSRNLSKGRVAVLAFSTVCFFSILALLTPAFAALGGNVSSVEQDRARMQGTLRTTQKQAFSVHEIQGASGMVVREYASPEGKVFGVAWQGSGHPDVSQLLGNYFEQYEKSIQNKRPGRGPLVVQQSGLVVQMGGHARFSTGRAYVPGMLPDGVTLDQIK